VSATSRRNGGSDPSTALIWAGVGLWAAGVVVTNTAVRLTADTPVPGGLYDWIGMPVAIATGQVSWTPAATRVAVGMGAGLLLLVLVVAVLRLRRSGRHHPIDRAAVHMARGKELAPLSHKTALATAARLNVEGIPGLRLGRTVIGKVWLYLRWEYTYLNISGPRTGKTAGTVVPVGLEAPGALLVTSNRRDVVDQLRDPRLIVGDVFVFDPQQIIGEEPVWWWNPLSYVLTGPERPEVKADRLASIFSIASVPPGSRGDRFFDPKGLNLLGHYLLAAALDGRPITDVRRWIVDSSDTTPVTILRKHHYPDAAKAVLSMMNEGGTKQVGGIFGTAELYTSFLTNSAAVEWITDPTGRRPHFDPDTFASSADTLFVVSREGRGSMAPLTTALTAAVCEAAEALAARSPRGRLRIPMVLLLDEVANVARWDQLPALFSHYGGRGIILMAFLQSWAQGVNVWGQHGMQAMLDAANVFVYGGGIRDTQFLNRLREMVDKFRYEKVTTNSSAGGRTTSRTQVDEDILSVGDLASVPEGKAVVFASGMRPTLVNLAYWFTGPRRKEVQASQDAHGPGDDGQEERPAPVEVDVPAAGDALSRWTT
jgi:type IV secretory pathway TraG/TraD family ATPase VirD4